MKKVKAVRISEKNHGQKVEVTYPSFKNGGRKFKGCLFIKETEETLEIYILHNDPDSDGSRPAGLSSKLQKSFEYGWHLQSIESREKLEKFDLNSCYIDYFSKIKILPERETIPKLKPFKNFTPKLDLNDRYTATVNYKEKIVEVGCQKIKFSKIRELMKLINSPKK